MTLMLRPTSTNRPRLTCTRAFRLTSSPILKFLPRAMLLKALLKAHTPPTLCGRQGPSSSMMLHRPRRPSALFRPTCHPPLSHLQDLGGRLAPASLCATSRQGTPCSPQGTPCLPPRYSVLTPRYSVLTSKVLRAHPKALRAHLQGTPCSPPRYSVLTPRYSVLTPRSCSLKWYSVLTSKALRDHPGYLFSSPFCERLYAHDLPVHTLTVPLAPSTVGIL